MQTSHSLVYGLSSLTGPFSATALGSQAPQNVARTKEKYFNTADTVQYYMKLGHDQIQNNLLFGGQRNSAEEYTCPVLSPAVRGNPLPRLLFVL